MPDPADAIATVRNYADAFNRGDVNAMTGYFDASGSILDGLPPHVWQGPKACEDWYRQAMVAGERKGATGYFISLGEPHHIDVTDDYAYVVAPATMTFKLKGQRITQSGATYTVALRKQDSHWRIRAWAWAKGANMQH